MLDRLGYPVIPCKTMHTHDLIDTQEAGGSKPPVPTTFFPVTA